MSEIFSITLPLFLIMGLGYLSVQYGLFERSDIKTLGTFVLMFAVPALIIRAYSQRTIGEMLNAHYLLACATGSLAVLLLGLALVRGVMKRPIDTAALSAMGMSCSNSAFIGYPLAFMVVGPIASVALSMNMLVENLLMMPLALALAELGQGQGESWGSVARGAALRLARSPIIASIVVGVGISLSGLKLALPLARTIDMLAMASGPVALFVIGATLHGLRLGGMLNHLVLVVVGKLVLHPLATLLALMFFPVANPELRTAAILMASVPMLSLFPLFGQRFGQEKFCSAALLVATVLSFPSLSAVLALLKL